MSDTQEFSVEESQIIATVTRFVDREVVPNVSKLESNGEYPEELVEQMKELGLFGIAIPEAYGGLGIRLPVFARVIEELARGWTTLAAYVNSHSTVAYAIAQYGTEAQREKYLPMLATGEHRGALCLTEPDAGSDLQSIRTIAKRTNGDFTIEGQKIFVTNGEKATLLLTLTKHRKGDPSEDRSISLFLLEKNTDGVSVATEFHKMAYGLVDTMEIRFDEVVVGESQLLGEREGNGFSQLMGSLEVGRIAIAASAIGLATNALSEAQRYASERKTFGKTIDRHQAVQMRMADMGTKLVTARLLTGEAAAVKDQNRRSDMISAMAKLYASEACHEIVENALRIHGGYGYIREYAIERLYRESPLYLVGEGTNDINKLVIARRMTEIDEKEYLRI